jgi:hypothetical protein
MLQLTPENYYSREADREYWSASQVKTFLDCPARAMAELRGDYERPESTALLVGSFVDAFFEGTLPAFTDAHPEIFKRGGELKADFLKALEMVDRARQDPLFLDYMEGEKQRIFTGEIGGLPFKGKFDVYRPGERIVDLKTARDLRPMYKPGEGRLSFADYWNWPLQMAIYRELEGHRLPCYLAVITKEDPPDIALVEIEPEKLDAELAFLLEKLPYFDAIKQGVVEPERCENCAWCRMSRKLAAPRPLESFIEIGGKELE